MVHLFFPTQDEVFGVSLGFLLSPLRNVDFFFFVLSSDAMVLDSGVNADAVSVNVRPEIFELKVIGDIAIELTVVEVPGITRNRTPYLCGRVRIASKKSDA